MSTFWLNFIILEAVGVAEAFIQVSTIKPGLKAALQNLIVAGQQVQQAIQSGQ